MFESDPGTSTNNNSYFLLVHQIRKVQLCLNPDADVQTAFLAIDVAVYNLAERPKSHILGELVEFVSQIVPQIFNVGRLGSCASLNNCERRQVTTGAGQGAQLEAYTY